MSSQVSRLKSMTMDEYYEKMKKFFSSDNKDKVIKIVSLSMGCAYHYWIDPSLMSRDKLCDIYWNFEPLMQVYFHSKDEMAKNLNVDFNNLRGFILRWLWRDDEIIYQPISIEESVDKFISEYKRNQTNEYLLGIRMDPFTYTGKWQTKKDKDGNDTGYMDQDSPEYKKDGNYRVFYVEITPEEFLKEESVYMDDSKHRAYKDDFISLGNVDSEYTDEFNKFIENHTDLT